MARGWPLAVVALPYACALAVLQRRYRIGYADSGLLGTSGGHPVPEAALRALAPDGLAAALVFATLAVVGVLVFRSRRGAAIALAAWIGVPLAFFTLVLVRSERPGRAPELVDTGIAVGEAWAEARPHRLVRAILRMDRAALADASR